MTADTLTDTIIRNLKAGGAGRLEVFDRKIPGFSVRVSPSGVKSFGLLLRAGGELQRMTLGRYPYLSLREARGKAKTLLGEVAKGGNPGAERRAHRKAGTFAELVEVYLADREVRAKRSYKEDVRITQKDLLPTLGPLRIHDIERHHIEGLVRRIMARKAGVMANRSLTLANRIFNFGIKKGHGVAANPCYGVSRPHEEAPRDRVYSDAEIRDIWNACESRPAWAASAVKILFLTAARRSEVVRMRWDEVDLDKGTWLLRRGRTKNRKPFVVTLPAHAVEILRVQKVASSASTFVFPGRTGEHPMTNIERHVNAIRVASGVTDFRCHDVRHTVATGLAKQGIGRFYIERILNHVDGSVTAIYESYEHLREKREALEGWAKDLLQIVAERRAA